MNILIIGCGRVGSELAELLDKRGHDVSVIDPARRTSTGSRGISPGSRRPEFPSTRTCSEKPE